MRFNVLVVANFQSLDPTRLFQFSTEHDFWRHEESNLDLGEASVRGWAISPILLLVEMKDNSI